MSDRAALLIEVGTEELPPLSLADLSEAFVAGIGAELTELSLAPDGARAFAAPRRLAVLVDSVRVRQPDTEETLKGPPTRIALDDKGNPGPAAKAFAEKCGVAFDALQRISDKKGEYLSLTREVAGKPIDELLGDALTKVLAGLPVVRPMRWGTGEHEFVRPVHWLTVLLDERPVAVRLYGQTASAVTYGHRFHAPGPLELAHARDYAKRLHDDGYVLADATERRQRIADAVTAVMAERGASTELDDALLDEVNALVEWPVAVVGRFDPEFLRLPPEVLISTLKKHQRYFPVTGTDGALRAEFVTVANVSSTQPEEIARGNERVVTPRLADAAFFYDADTSQALSSRVEKLDAIVFEASLGSIGDKTRRVAALSKSLAPLLGVDPNAAQRVAHLSRADLVTDMVGEFPDLQGIMGRYYALGDNEPADVADAIGDFYRPAFAGDRIPGSALGQVVALCDRADTLAGVFAAGKKPKGNKDPFGLRRAALGLARISIEGELSFSLPALLDAAVAGQPLTDKDSDLSSALYEFIVDRLRAQTLATHRDMSGEIFDAVAANRPASLVDFVARLEAVTAFARFDEAEALAAANKRIANLLRKSDVASDAASSAALFELEAEQALHSATATASSDVQPLLEQQSYTEVLQRLAGLREPIDRFFDEVMVMTDDAAVRDNRLALLAEIRRSFLEVADISVLSRAR
ncbi:MAG: glycine--tRNA ligase subunit beta [Pseudomonadota bacterium]